jgi:catechol 2,3-dioxygenase-like lactoylglutathione lyase family enzyme
VTVGFDHVTLAVRDLDAAKRFLAVLGFEEDKATVVSGPAMAAYMGIPGWEADHVTLVLRGAPDRQEIQLICFHEPPLTVDAGSGTLSRTGFNHLCLRTESISATLANLAAIGVEPRNEVMEFHDRRLVFVTGPEGVVIELAEWTTPAAVPGTAH